MNTQNESDTQQDFEALYLAYRAKYEAEKERADYAWRNVRILEKARHEQDAILEKLRVHMHHD